MFLTNSSFSDLGEKKQTGTSHNIPLEIIPVEGSSPNTFQKIVQLQSIIRAEDKISYQNSLKETPEG